MLNEFAYAAAILSTAFSRAISRKEKVKVGSVGNPGCLDISWVCSDDNHFIHYITWFRNHQYYLTINTRDWENTRNLEG